MAVIIVGVDHRETQELRKYTSEVQLASYRIYRFKENSKGIGEQILKAFPAKETQLEDGMIKIAQEIAVMEKGTYDEVIDKL